MPDSTAALRLFAARTSSTTSLHGYASGPASPLIRSWSSVSADAPREQMRLTSRQGASRREQMRTSRREQMRLASRRASRADTGASRREQMRTSRREQMRLASRCASRADTGASRREQMRTSRREQMRLASRREHTRGEQTRESRREQTRADAGSLALHLELIRSCPRQVSSSYPFRV